MIGAHAANRAWVAWNLADWGRYRRALADPGPGQRRILRRLLDANAGTEFGRRFGFDTIDSVEAFQRNVPIMEYGDYEPFIERIRAGRHGVLTREPVRRLVPTSGSTGPRKLVPFTRSLQGELNRAIGPWIVDLFASHPELGRGPAYWSISPVEPMEGGASAVPIGFDDDSAYLGGLMERLVRSVLVVPPATRLIENVEAFRYVTLRWMLSSPELRVVSVWHPSFLTLLMEPLGRFWGRLIGDVERGTLTPPSHLPPAILDAVRRGLRPDPKRAAELGLRGAHPERLWPRLGLISCWADGASGRAVADVQRLFPQAVVQPKGLFATEGFVTLPFDGLHPVAVRSHFYEFLDDSGRPHLADGLRQGEAYTVVVTTGGGLYRYRLGDRVRVDGMVRATPSLRFMGRDATSDLFGEKLTDAFVSAVLDGLLEPIRSGVSFAMVAPDERDGAIGYTLFIEVRDDPPDDLAARLEQRLGENGHYRYCVRLGQLACARVFRISRGAAAAYTSACREGGQRLGEIKLPALRRDSGWRERFDGHYVDVPERLRGGGLVRSTASRT